jgi:alanyl-tRNA synthetase
LGYERDEGKSSVLAIVANNALVTQAKEGDKVELVFAETPFYGESGGQLGDGGTIETETGLVEIEDTQKPLPGLWVHVGKVKRGEIQEGQLATLTVDSERRNATRRNHSATHLLHLGLRNLIGEHAQQKGSVVGPERLRFDFTHNVPLSDEQIEQLENFVNLRILENVRRSLTWRQRASAAP